MSKDFIPSTEVGQRLMGAPCDKCSPPMLGTKVNPVFTALSDFSVDAIYLCSVLAKWETGREVLGPPGLISRCFTVVPTLQQGLDWLGPGFPCEREWG